MLEKAKSKEKEKKQIKNHSHRTTRKAYQMVLKALKSQDLSLSSGS